MTVYSFGPTHVPVRRLSVCASTSSTSGVADGKPGPSTSAPSPSSSWDAEWRYLRAQVHQMDERLTNLALHMSQMS